MAKTSDKRTASRSAGGRSGAAAKPAAAPSAKPPAPAARRPTPPKAGTRLSGAQSLMKALELEGVDVMFGIPGGAILPAYDPLVDSSVRHVLMRHEQGAGHAAEGYAHATGRPGVCMATSGPGGCNLVTALADAYMDSIPVVAITGQVPTAVVGNDAFQEAYITGITMPVTKHNSMVTDAADIPRAIREAFHIASTGRPGPVLVDLPKDILIKESEFAWPEEIDIPGYKPTTKGNVKQVREAVKLILAAERPVVYAGGGIIRAEAAPELRKLAETGNLPVVTTLMGRGAFPDTHELGLGMPGMHGHYTAVTAMQQADLLISIGVRFDDRVTGNLATFAPGAKVIHVDIDPAEIGKNRAVDVPVVGDAKDVTGSLVRELAKAQEERGVPDRSPWLATLADWKRRFPLRYRQEDGGTIKPQFVMDRLYEATHGEATIVSGVGQHQMWASQHYKFTRPRQWINSGGLGTMGFAVPAALGAKIAKPDELVVAVDGDGCFQMTAQELATSTTENIPIVVALLNNGYLGMVRQWQELFYNERYSEVHLSQTVPDYVKLAEAFGAVGLRAESPEDVDAVLDKALSIGDRSVVIDFRVDQGEMVFPMVPAGASNDDIILGPEFVKPVDDPAEAPVA